MRNKTLSKVALQNRIERADIAGLEHRKQFFGALLGVAVVVSSAVLASK